MAEFHLREIKKVGSEGTLPKAKIQIDAEMFRMRGSAMHKSSERQP